jgi:hypothetical protein
VSELPRARVVKAPASDAGALVLPPTDHVIGPRRVLRWRTLARGVLLVAIGALWYVSPLLSMTSLVSASAVTFANWVVVRQERASIRDFGAHIDAGRIDAAEHVLDRVVAGSPTEGGSAGVSYLRAVVALRRGDAVGALLFADSAIASATRRRDLAVRRNALVVRLVALIELERLEDARQQLAAIEAIHTAEEGFEAAKPRLRARVEQLARGRSHNAGPGGPTAG